MNNKFLEFRLSTVLKLELASFLEKCVSHDRPSQISHGPQLHTLAYYLTAGPAKDDLAKTLTIFVFDADIQHVNTF